MRLNHGTRRPEAVAQRLQRAIQKGEFKPGQAIPSERVLAERWKLSRPLVREGIAILIGRGLLCRKQGKGTYLNDAVEQIGVQVWADMARQHEHLQADLLEFRHMLECRAAELAAERHDESDRERLRIAGTAVEEAWGATDRRAQLTADVAFHHTIAEATHNPVFTYLMSSLHKLLLDHMQLTQAGTQPRSAMTKDVQQQHRDMLQAILARNAAAASRAAATHLEYVRVRLNHLDP